ncbi:hypothetical protein MD484_g1957, partial [Candolleomyces efflorescens]
MDSFAVISFNPDASIPTDTEASANQKSGGYCVIAFLLAMFEVKAPDTQQLYLQAGAYHSYPLQ